LLTFIVVCADLPSLYGSGLPSLDADTASPDQQTGSWDAMDVYGDQDYSEPQPCRTLGGSLGGSLGGAGALGGGGVKRGYDGREKLSGHPVDAVVASAEVDPLTASANRNRSYNGTLEGFVREKLPTLSASKDRLSPVPRPRPGIQPREAQVTSNSAPDRTNYKAVPLQEENRPPFSRKPALGDTPLDVRDAREIRDVRDAREKEAREAKEREARLARDVRLPREVRDVRDVKEVRDARMVRESRDDVQEHRAQPRSARDAREREARGGVRDPSRDAPRDAREHRHISRDGGATQPLSRDGLNRDNRPAYRDSQERDVRLREREERVPDSHHDNEQGDPSQPSNVPQREEYEYPDYNL